MKYYENIVRYHELPTFNTAGAIVFQSPADSRLVRMLLREGAIPPLGGAMGHQGSWEVKGSTDS